MGRNPETATDSTHRTLDTPAPIDWEAHLARTLHVAEDEDSHTERDPVTFHPSQLARCKRQAVISKFGLDDHDTDTLGTFHVGTLIHEFLEASFSGRFPGVHHEQAIEQQYEDADGEIVVTGHADVWDEHHGVVYDWKTRNGWYKFEPPTERHLDQLTLYMDALDAEAGQVVYLNKADLEVRTWPEDGTFAFDTDRRDALLEKAREIRAAIEQVGDITSRADVPFAPCDCWICSQEPEGEDDG
jgi:hypothetical protein